MPHGQQAHGWAATICEFVLGLLRIECCDISAISPWSSHASKASTLVFTFAFLDQIQPINPFCAVLTPKNTWYNLGTTCQFQACLKVSYGRTSQLKPQGTQLDRKAKWNQVQWPSQQNVRTSPPWLKNLWLCLRSPSARSTCISLHIFSTKSCHLASRPRPSWSLPSCHSYQT